MSNNQKSTDQIPDLEGWNWFDQANKPLDEKREENTGLSRDDYERSFRNIFSGQDGQIALGYLAAYVQSMPGFDPRLGDFYNAAASGFYRQGMQDLVQHIFHMTQPKTERAKGTNK